MANQLKMAEVDAILALHRRRWSIRRIAKALQRGRQPTVTERPYLGHCERPSD